MYTLWPIFLFQKPFKTGKDGRFIIRDEDDDGDEGEQDGYCCQLFAHMEDSGNPAAMDDSDGDEGLTHGRGIHRDRKRQHGNDDEDEEEEEEADSRSRFSRASSSSRHTNATHFTSRTSGTRFTDRSAGTQKSGKTGRSQAPSAAGSSYRSKVQAAIHQMLTVQKAGGDVQKKGMPQPYAYLPLDNSQLNKRFARMAGCF
jgi:hypothetical protein